MDVKSFLITFEQSLINCGFSSEEARSHTLKIAKSLKDNDKRRIYSMEDKSFVKGLAENYASKIEMLRKRREISKTNPDTMTISKHFSESVTANENASPEDRIQNYVTDNAKNIRAVDKEHIASSSSGEDEDVKINKPQSFKSDEEKSSTKTKTPRAATQKIERIEKQKAVPLTPEGKENYKRWLMSSGIGLGIALFFASLGSFIVYALIAALITALIAVLVALVAIGCVGTLAGLIYGVVKIVSVVPEGLYELGLALVIFGITLAASIGIYNLAMRVVPILWKNFTKYLKEKTSELRIYLNRIRTECNGE